MLTLLVKTAKGILAPLLKILPVVVYLIKIPYWAVVRLIINFWGKRGVHSITVGQFAGGTTKTRSLYREEMLLKTMILLLDIKGKSCLDLACNDGFWSFQLARFRLKNVTGIEMKEESVAKANFLKQIYDFPGFKFRQRDIIEFLYDNNAKSYDIILLLSILYHLPETTDWNRFFGALSKINNECLVIDSRWFEDDAYWYDKTTTGQAIIETDEGVVKKWRPTRKEIFEYLYKNGYDQVVELNPSPFLSNPKEAYGNGDPYTLENVSDYITGQRTLVVAYKDKAGMPNILNNLTVEYVAREN